MLSELRSKSQITIPKQIVSSLNLNEGDKLEITEKDGVIQIVPVAVYPKKYIDEIQDEINTIKSEVASGKRPVFDNIDSMFDALKWFMKITYSQRFEKSYKKLNDQEKTQVRSKLKILAENPSHPSLRCKRIQGIKELFECSVNMDIRIIWHYENDELILLLDIGHHDILKKF